MWVEAVPWSPHRRAKEAFAALEITWLWVEMWSFSPIMKLLLSGVRLPEQDGLSDPGVGGAIREVSVTPSG